MSDTPQGGWWKAKDGQWYPPETHPDHAAAVSAGPPAAGWWRATDGNWYPPESPPAYRQAGPVGGPAEPLGTEGSPGADTPAPGGRSRPALTRQWLLVILGVLAVVAAAAVAGVLILGGGDDPTPRSTTSTTEAPDATTPTTTTTTSSTTTTTTTPVVSPPAGLSRTGSAVVAMPSTISEQYLALVTHDGGGAFGLSLLDAAGTAVQEPMGAPAAGRYLGVLPVNFVAGQSFASVRVDADGPWAVTFALVKSAPTASTTPGAVYSGTGDQVVQFVADADTPVSVGCADCGSPMSVVAFGGDGAPGALLGVVGGVTTVPAGTRLLQITARAGAAGSLPTWTLAP